MKKILFLSLLSIICLHLNAQTPIYTLNGEKTSKEKIDSISPDLIESVSVWKGEKALQKFGNEAANGWIEIKTIIPDKNAEFIGGDGELGKYLVQEIQSKKIKSKKAITSFVQFKVEKDGSISQAKIIQSGGKELDEIALNAVKNSPKWKPAEKNGQAVPSINTLPIRYQKGPIN